MNEKPKFGTIRKAAREILSTSAPSLTTGQERRRLMEVFNDLREKFVADPESATSFVKTLAARRKLKDRLHDAEIDFTTLGKVAREKRQTLIPQAIAELTAVSERITPGQELESNFRDVFSRYLEELKQALRQDARIQAEFAEKPEVLEGALADLAEFETEFLHGRLRILRDRYEEGEEE